MRSRIVMLLMLLCVATAAPAQVNISFNVSTFPDLVQVPGYPVYYAPRVPGNYFFYDGMYWAYGDDAWYSSDWYNGPWWRVAPEFVPVYVLRVPVRYYQRPPPYFQAWRRDAPPRWGEHWGRDWEQRRVGWDKWDRRTAPRPAPLPTYQRQYSGNRYPRVEEQHALQNQKYHYQPKDALVREHVQPQIRGASAPAAQGRQPEPSRKDSGKDARERDQKQGPGRPTAQKAETAVPPQSRATVPHEPPRKAEPAIQAQPRAIPHEPPQKAEPAIPAQPRAIPHEPPQKAAPAVPPQSRETIPHGAAGEPSKGQDKGPGKAHEKGEERGRESNK